MIASLQEAVDRKNTAEVAKKAHALKGAIANFTSGMAFKTAVELEQQARENDLRAASELLHRLRREVDSLTESLKLFTNVVSKER